MANNSLKMPPNDNNNDYNSVVVAEYYNKKDNVDIDTRSKSRIYYLRNFNNWIKSVLINEIINKIRYENRIRDIFVLDIGCGKGGDIKKWQKGRVAKVTFTDIAENSLEECKRRHQELLGGNQFRAEFVCLDSTKELISEALKEPSVLHDLVSSQFVIHYSFESFEQADRFMKNVSDSLKEGGYFIGTTTNSLELVRRLRASDDYSFVNDIYKISFVNLNDKKNIPIFGAKFDFHLDDVVECPEYVLDFRVLEEIAKRHNLKLLFKKSFADFFAEYSSAYKYMDLVKIMKALEPYYPLPQQQQQFKEAEDQSSARQKSNEYEYIDEKLKSEQFKNSLGRDEAYATLTKSEWEVATLYLVFAFVKSDSSNAVDQTNVNNDKKAENATNKSSDENEIDEKQNDTKNSRLTS
jgi:mRNA (guanine-N7-)-methyltransferase